MICKLKFELSSTLLKPGPLIHEQSRRISNSLNEDSTIFHRYVRIKRKPDRQKYFKRSLDDEARLLSEKESN